MADNALDHRAMAPKSKARPKTRVREPHKLRLREWIVRLGRSQVEVARAVGLTEGYISNLANDEREKRGDNPREPSPTVLLDISDFLGITVNDLYRDPPPQSALEVTERLSPAEIAILGRLLAKNKS